MRGLVAAHAEIARRAHQSLAEVPLPNPIDNHARGQRIVTVRDCAGQLQPATPLREGLTFVAGQYCRETARHFRARIVRIAADVNARGLGLWYVLDVHRARRSLVE